MKEIFFIKTNAITSNHWRIC